MISPEDLDLFSYADTPNEAFEIITKQLIETYELDKFIKK